MASSTQSLSLKQARSAYLRAHAGDAVAWQQWGPVALEEARQQRRPILLSIGYAVSEGCRQMQRECFQAPAVAAVLNREFVCILVDRNERPDIDVLYQEAFRLLNGHGGGWPLNMMLTADDLLPFFGATYLALEPRGGLPGCAELLQRLACFHRDHADQVYQQNRQLAVALRTGPPRHGRTGYTLNPGPLAAAVQRLEELFDSEYGGFGMAAKFPQVPQLERLLRHWQHAREIGEPDTGAGERLRFTLERMARSALWHRAGGFYRATRDRAWQEPQRERLLTDNAQLLALYAQAAQALAQPQFGRLAGALADWLLAALATPGGGFMAALGEDDLRDEAITTAGNAMLIRALALAGRHLERPDLIAAAERALAFVRSTLWRDGALAAWVATDDAALAAFLDDHAWLLLALLELLQCRWHEADFHWARALAEALLERFQDHGKQGGFFYTSDAHEPLPERLKPIRDDSLAAANGIAAYALLRLGQLSNDLRYPLAAERALKNAWPAVERNPVAHCGLLLALEEYYFPSVTVVIRGAGRIAEAWWRACASRYAPRRMVLPVPPETPVLPAGVRDCVALGGVAAYLCQRGKCSAPVTDLAALQQALADAMGAR